MDDIYLKRWPGINVTEGIDHMCTVLYVHESTILYHHQSTTALDLWLSWLVSMRKYSKTPLGRPPFKQKEVAGN